MGLKFLFRSDHRQHGCPSLIRQVHSRLVQARPHRAFPPLWLSISKNGAQRSACSAALKKDNVSQNQKGKPSLGNILQGVQKAIGITFPEDKEACFSGNGIHMGMGVSWQLRCRGVDGAFIEEIRGRHLSFKYGHPGVSTGTRTAQTWGMEWDDLPKELQLDDNEALLIQAWVRTGFWVTEQALDHLAISVNSEAEREELRAPEASESRLSSVHVPEDGPSTSDLGAQDTEESVVLSLRLRRGKVKALLWVCTRTWQPLRLACPLCGQIDMSTYEHWTDWQTSGPSIRHPKLVVQRGGTGGNNSFATVNVSWQPRSAPQSYLMPPCP
ncbi:hypothetical protein COCSUDRAFT_46683, partial [Coccomyxa subellipsoidea C-169]